MTSLIVSGCPHCGEKEVECFPVEAPQRMRCSCCNAEFPVQEYFEVTREGSFAAFRRPEDVPEGAMSRRMDKFWMKLAWCLPRALVKWCAYRVGAHATQGQWSNQEVPALTFMDAMKRWDEPKAVE